MIEPHELKSKQFSKVVRGYSQTEVDEHIDFVIAEYTKLYRENDELSRKLAEAEAQVEAYKKDEESIRSALINACLLYTSRLCYLCRTEPGSRRRLSI